MKTTINKNICFHCNVFGMHSDVIHKLRIIRSIPRRLLYRTKFLERHTQVDGYMKGLHSYLRGTYSSLFNMGELRSGLLGDGDDGTGTSVFGESLAAQTVIKQDLREDNAYLSLWNGLYSEIVRVNLAIKEIPNCSFLSESQKNIYLGQAYGMRAYYYIYCTPHGEAFH